MSVPQKQLPIVQQSLIASTKFATSFQNFISQQNQLAAQNVNAYQNLAPAVGTMTTPGEVLASASFYPADPGAKYTAGRGSFAPASYIVLNRAGTAAASIASTALLPAVQNFISTPQVPICPHIMIGYTGTVIQLVDLSNTAHYLQLGPQNAPNPMVLTPAGLIEGVIELTIANEGADASYSAFAGNDNGHGIAVGCIQFNQQVGGLYALCVAMNKAAPKTFKSIFGTLVPTLLNQKTLTNLKATNLSHTGALWAAAGRVPVFQQVQRALAATNYFTGPTGIFNAASKFHLTSQRAFAILYDTNVQWGLGKVGTKTGVNNFGDTAQQYVTQVQNIPVTSDAYELAFLTKFAELADHKVYQRRTNLLYSIALSDGPLYTTFPPGQTDTQVQDQSCVYIVLEGRYGDPTTPAMIQSLAQVILQCQAGLAIPATNSRVIPWTTWDHPGVSADPTMGDFPFDVLFSQIQSPSNVAPAPLAVFQPPSSPLTFPTNSTVAQLTASLAAAATKGFKSAALHAYDVVKAQARSLYLTSPGRANSYIAAITQSQNASSTNGADSANAIAAANALAIQNLPLQADTTGLLFDFTTGKWNDGDAT